MNDSSIPTVITAFMGLLSVTFSLGAQSGVIPPTPQREEQNRHIFDYVNVISESDKRHIQSLQSKAYKQHDTHIVVITLSSMRDYGSTNESISQFARRWFNKWEIGKRKNGTLYNRGILLMVSMGDRKARIELGAEWGHRWDEYCQEIMDNKIIPRFKKGNFSGGIRNGVRELTRMAKQGPSSSPPSKGLLEQINDKAKNLELDTTPFSGLHLIGLVGLGILLIIVSYLPDDEQVSWWLLVLGIGIIVLATITYVIVFVIVGHFMPGDGSSGGFSGGFGTGGFSGGGGATGGW